MNGTNKLEGTRLEENAKDLRYQDMLDLPHPVSLKHPQMSVHDRAAQFAPFRALTGHEQAIRETARLTDRQPELDEERIHSLNRKMRLLLEHLGDRPQIEITCFLPDQRKEGGSCEIIAGAVKKIDLPGDRLVMEDGREICIHNIVEMEGPVFSLPEFL